MSAGAAGTPAGAPAHQADAAPAAPMGDFDILVVGGGINGCGIARDLAGRGFRVCLLERGDLAGATSSASTKLIHGGLRYLEHYEFRLVREALAEREVMLRIAPHIVWPMRFVLPHRPEMRPRWLIRAGLFLYDRLARRVSLPGHEAIDCRAHPYGAPLAAPITHAFAYSDCWVEDARLVLLNARDAARRGATILTRTALVTARRADGRWEASAERADGRRIALGARAIVNAAGPWAAEMLGRAGRNSRGRVRLVKGSHIVVPALHDGPQAYLLQNHDRRVVFVIPYERRFSLIGTTDIPFEGDARAARAEEDEIAYLCAAVAAQFRRAPRPADVVWTYSGVRPLYDDGAADASSVTRDYLLELDAPGGAAPILSVFGGKITTYRRLAEEAVGLLAKALGMPAGTGWTATAPLPGGDLGPGGLAAFEAEAARRHPWLPAEDLARMVRCYGSELEDVLGGATSPAGLGAPLGAGLTERELDWMRRHEWAATAEDVLWRRTKLGLRMSAAEQAALAARMEAAAQGETC
ncbi:glycerol-3-phosphate dehydrogenase [Roseomonas alkaliterrae]|uniref:Glycerol-3-phosphate dehydrogenase n=1 Tax=Neoroseomonas alkaliterrae TaxID=1452450 RepID=A0A840Y591_9PROT|nr:glycerol-3-phosphate dehydrogenase [Neoroseomonas alkaliterrae]MBB5691537.1 glycerol-3-phosphate dehydrogenase [Neoroseomonas alkaliterrae]MBR0676592.1 glycerol-3-phosphate dehydrogenase [Neoroseomonas alkaliterrae]